ncbi:GLPGLI family protein [Chryseobacterium gregarium]|uniref:GLPGLI family protein n=1 Tax=Chryseobacterium gregarium TaxID=456299 RepID=UPI000480F8FC|nr:GLPGLI family protein [Chryseobacterium gregarium]
MISKTLFPFLLCIFSFLSAQQVNRFIYELRYKEDSASTLYKSERMCLDVDDLEYSFRSYDRFILDSLYHSDSNKEYEEVGNILYVIKRKAGNSSFVITEVQGAIRYTYDDSVIPDWSVTSEKKKDDHGNQLQKAVAFFKGRKWNAYFNPEIPINTGPYKFYGLPGLIVELYDDKNDYHFKLIGNHKLLRKDIDIPSSRYVDKDLKVSKTKFLQIIAEYKKDPARDFKAGVYNGTIKLVDRDPNEIIRGIEEKSREDQKKYNNPIELAD